MKINQRTTDEILSEIKLRMIYDTSKTLDQNKKVLEEQNYGENMAKSAGYAAGAGALAGGAYGATTASSIGLAGTMAGETALSLGGTLGLTGAAAGAIGGGIIAAAAALALSPIIIWWLDKDNAEGKVAKMFKYCAENKDKIDQVPRGLDDEQIFDLSNKLYDALKGLGTTEEAVYEVFNSLQTISDLAALIDTFNTETSSEGEGDILNWLTTDIDSTAEWNQIYRPIRKIVYRFMKDLAKENPPKKDDGKPEPGKTEGGYKPCTGTYSYGCYAVAIGEVQKCLGLLVDNKFGPKTLAALKAKANMETFTDSDIAVICKAANTPQVPPREEGLQLAPLAPSEAGTLQTNPPQEQPKLQPSTYTLPAQTFTKYQQYFEKDPEAPGRFRYKGPDLKPEEFNLINKFLKDNYGLTFIKKRLPKDYGAKYVWAKI